jgi:hypothetical protein
MIRKMNIALTTLAWAAWASTAFAQTLLWSDAFGNPTGWAHANGQISYANQQLAVSGSFGPTDTNNPSAYLAYAYHPIPSSGPLPDNQTLEARVDLVSANQNDAWATVAFLWFDGSTSDAYHFFKDQDEVGLLKVSGGAPAAAFFYTNDPVKNQNVTLVLSLTRLGSDLRINTRVLDKDNANAVLFERTVTDTPQADPVLPNRAIKGLLSGPDLPGTPWPVANAPGYVLLGMEWANPQSSSAGVAEAIFDNLEVWQYESPQLNIQSAVVLSWPLTDGQFVLESASSVNGLWAPVPDPWWRTNAGQNQVSILAPDNLKLFRLRSGP